jgi:hypothetical protein
VTRLLWNPLEVLIPDVPAIACVQATPSMSKKKRISKVLCTHPLDNWLNEIQRWFGLDAVPARSQKFRAATSALNPMEVCIEGHQESRDDHFGETSHKMQKMTNEEASGTRRLALLHSASGC